LTDCGRRHAEASRERSIWLTLTNQILDVRNSFLVELLSGHPSFLGRVSHVLDLRADSQVARVEARWGIACVHHAEGAAEVEVEVKDCGNPVGVFGPPLEGHVPVAVACQRAGEDPAAAFCYSSFRQ
jgi:hypothetical protein